MEYAKERGNLWQLKLLEAYWNGALLKEVTSHGGTDTMC